MAALKRRVLLAMWATGCGEPLHDGMYFGEELWVMSGPLTVPQESAGSGEGGRPPEDSSDGEPLDEPVPIGWGDGEAFATTVFWAGQGPGTRLPVVSEVLFPYSHAVTLYAPPDLDRSEQQDPTTTLGLPVLFGDTNGNRLLDLDERVWGVGAGVLVRYTPSGTDTPVAEDFDLKPFADQGILPILLGYDEPAIPDLDCDGQAFEDAEWAGICYGGCVEFLQ